MSSRTEGKKSKPEAPAAAVVEAVIAVAESDAVPPTSKQTLNRKYRSAYSCW